MIVRTWVKWNDFYENTMYNTSKIVQLELPFGFRPRTRLMLSEVERLIKKYRIMVPCPSRQTLIRMCEDGTFETPDPTPGRRGWLVFEDSFWRWAGCDEDKIAA